MKMNELLTGNMECYKTLTWTLSGTWNDGNFSFFNIGIVFMEQLTSCWTSVPRWTYPLSRHPRSLRDAPQVQFHIVKVQKLIKFPHFIWSIFNKVPIWFNGKIQKLLKIPHYSYLYFIKFQFDLIRKVQNWVKISLIFIFLLSWAELVPTAQAWESQLLWMTVILQSSVSTAGTSVGIVLRPTSTPGPLNCIRPGSRQRGAALSPLADNE